MKKIINRKKVEKNNIYLFCLRKLLRNAIEGVLGTRQTIDHPLKIVILYEHVCLMIIL